MTLGGAVKNCFRNYATFSGRASRSEFWKFILFCLLVGILLTILNSLLFGPRDEMIVKVKRAQVNFAFTFDATSTYLFRETGYTIESYFSLVVRCMQCGQIGQILKSFDDKFSLKIDEIYGDFVGFSAQVSFFSKNYRGFFLGNF